MSITMFRGLALTAMFVFAGCSGGSAATGNDAGLGGSASGGAGGVPGSAGAPGGSGGGVASLTLEAAMTDYMNWTKLMDQPASISAEISGLCRLPTLPEKQFNASEHGNERLLLYWGNAAAAPAFVSKTAAAFAVGAAIVKEKFLPTASGRTLIGKGAMIKRAPGFDPAHGDWEFAYWEETSGLLHGADEAQYCGGCHAGAATDYVFLDRSWQTPKAL